MPLTSRFNNRYYSGPGIFDIAVGVLHTILELIDFSRRFEFVFELVKAGGFIMLPILLCSVVATAIIAERFWSLQRKRIVPDNLVVEVWQWAKKGGLDEEHIQLLRQSSPLGKILAAGLVNRQNSREIMKEGIEEAGRHVVYNLEQYLNTLGTIAAIAPLLGLLGTVIGMIKVFAVITVQGIGDPGVLASGISEALITTAAGLTVAIPSLIFYRYFRGRIDGLVVTMEQEALKMVDVLEGIRRRDRYSSESVR
uniref:Biopolymer transport protein ExbB n=1 Tax=Candidatus Kentrum sp. FW TaxID=2126338 RepID=A0A450T2W6_9GAMM|nr:MAG: biopolymer transport protein ExbB [Candidatus Kentron sp. FW]VFJ60640.1 MAG: biopolymer transport protein ExbB [Candidatus Kentron sp. FW]